MRLPVRITWLGALVAVCGAVPSVAQVDAVNLFVYGGGYSPLRNLRPDGTADFKTGFTLGGGIGVQVDPTVELRLSLTGAQAQFRNAGQPTGVYLNRYYLAGDIKAQYAFPGGVTPYGLFGAGAVLLHEKGTSGNNKTKGFAHLGAGVAYAIRGNLSAFIQGDGFFYGLSELRGGALESFTRAQSDVGWSVGVSYRLRM